MWWRGECKSRSGNSCVALFSEGGWRRLRARQQYVIAQCIGPGIGVRFGCVDGMGELPVKSKMVLKKEGRRET